MTPVALSPLRQQGDVSRTLVALLVVLLQDSGAPSMATLSRVQGSSSPSMATLACTQGLGTSLPNTLVHSYAPRCTSGPSPCIYKREVQGHPGGGFARGKERTNELSLSPYRDALVTPTTSGTLVQDNTRLAPHLVFHPAPTHLGRGTQRFHSSVQGPPGSETPTVGALGRVLLRVGEHLPVEIQMGSLQQPLQPGMVLRFGSLELMSLDGSYDMVLLPSRRDDSDGLRLAQRRRARRQHLPAAEEEHSGRLSHPPRRRRRRWGNHGHAGGGTLSAIAPERVDDAGTPPGDMSGIVLAPETMAGVTSP
jgi:hypothetical protein